MGTEQKVAVITGASQGIGAALVKAYRDRNYRIVATARSIKPSNEDDVLNVPGDIADPKTAERVIAEAMARFGRIDTLVNNAGIFIAKPFTQYSEADFAGLPSTSPASSASPSWRLRKWKSRAAATSCRSRRAWSITRSMACLPCWRR